jgi:hypothetical protein
MKSLITYFVLLFLILYSCTKDKTPLPLEPPEPTKWELITGSYKVYDTTGFFLYNMSINYIHNPNNNTDTLAYQNLDNNFNVNSRQLNFGSNVSKYFITVGPKDTLFDKQNRKWKLLAIADTMFNTFKNDTIKLKFRITNINYWMLDAVPYCDTTKIQIAVKQH